MFLLIASLSFIFAAMIKEREESEECDHQLAIETAQPSAPPFATVIVNPLTETPVHLQSTRGVDNQTTIDMPPAYEDFMPPPYGEVATNFVQMKY